jgi:hypothetical protein
MLDAESRRPERRTHAAAGRAPAAPVDYDRPMTPAKCAAHELRPGELADAARYTRALQESRTCLRCRALAVRAWIVWAWRGFPGPDGAR